MSPVEIHNVLKFPPRLQGLGNLDFLDKCTNVVDMCGLNLSL